MSVTQSTPGRNTKLLFGAIGTPIVQPAFAVDRTAREINASDSEQLDNVEYVDGIGYRLRAYQVDLHNLWEGSNQSPLLTGSFATGFEEAAYFAPEGLTGVTYSGAATTGMIMRQKQVAAGDSWDVRLSADETAFPGPLSGAITDLDRVFASSANHTPDQPLLFQFVLPSSGLQLTGPVASVGFTGPAGSDEEFTGYGQYFLVCLGTGRAVLFERGIVDSTEEWRKRYSFPYSQVQPGGLQTIQIMTNGSEACGTGWKGNTIVFGTMNAAEIGEGFMLVEVLLHVAQQAVSRSRHVYRVPGAPEATVHPTLARVDIRRDVRALFALGTVTYPTEGTLTDEPVGTPGVINEAEPVEMQWFGDVPTGCDIEAKLYCGSHSSGSLVWQAMTATVESSNCHGATVSFAVPAGFTGRHLKAEFVLSGSGTATPTLASYHLERPAVAGEAVAVETTIPGARGTAPAVPTSLIESVSITSAAEDPAQESGSFEIGDLLSDGPELRIRTGTPLDVAVVDDDDVVLTYLHRGIIQAVSSKVLSRRGVEYPDDESFTASVITGGEWVRVSRVVVPKTITFFDPNVGQPWKVTDAIRYCFKHFCGYTDAQLDIPDSAIRLLADENKLESGTRIDEVVKRWVDDYLGGYLRFDRNAGTDGMWRLQLRKSPPYDVLLRFTPEHPGSGKIVTPIASYGTTTAPSGQVIQTMPMMGVQQRTEPPEGNVVVVYGSAAPGRRDGLVMAGNAKSSGVRQLSQVAVNFNSVNLLGLDAMHAGYPDKTSPDYLGEAVVIEVRDPALNTQEAIDWVTRRVYDAAVYARKYLTFTSYLPLITVAGDTHQELPRPPQFYDIVEVWEGGDWVPYVVVKADAQYQKSGFMFMQYELMTSTAIQTQFAVARSSMSQFRYVRSVLAKLFRDDSGLGGYRKPVASAGRAFSLSPAAMSALPEGVATPLQDWDPDSPTFGQFYFLPGYDPVP